jgi:hypothetical protein
MSTTVRKITGTHGESACGDQLSATILAFAHYVLQHTACNLHFADLQGIVDDCSFCVEVTDKFIASKDIVDSVTTYVLFDPQTHTIDG